MWSAEQQRRSVGHVDESSAAAGLLVFGYASKLFGQENGGETAVELEEKHRRHGHFLIPWRGDATNMIDRYDCRLFLTELDEEGQQTRPVFRLVEEDRAEEEVCDTERYRDLWTNEQQAEKQYAAIATNYDSTSGSRLGAQIPYSYGDENVEDIESKEEADASDGEDGEPFKPPAELKAPVGMDLPATKKQNAIIERTALFVVKQGMQMEILIKARQGNSPKFGFLCWDHKLNAYYKVLLKAIREKRYTPAPVAGDKVMKRERRTADDGVESDEDSDGGDYLHPSLFASSSLALGKSASTPAFAAQRTQSSTGGGGGNELTVPRIEYKLGEGNDVYSQLFKQLSAIRKQQQDKADAELSTGLNKKPNAVDETPAEEPAEVLSSPAFATDYAAEDRGPPPPDYSDWHVWFYNQPAMFAAQPPVVPCPPDLNPVVKKTAEFVAKFGPRAEHHLRNRPELRLDFLYAGHPYHGFYHMKLRWELYEQYCRRSAEGTNSVPADVTGAIAPSQAPPQTQDASPARVLQAKKENQMETNASCSVPPPPPPLVGQVESSAISEEKPASKLRRKRRFFHDAPLNEALPVKSDATISNTPSASQFQGPISFALGKAEQHRPQVHLKQDPLLSMAIVGGEEVTFTEADLQRQQERKLKAKSFLEKIMADKEAAKKKATQIPRAATESSLSQLEAATASNSEPTGGLEKTWSVPQAPSRRRRRRSRGSSSSSSKSKSPPPTRRLSPPSTYAKTYNRRRRDRDNSVERESRRYRRE